MRLIDGLAGATAAEGIKFNRKEIEQTISGLGQRVFLMNNVHKDAPVVFETRWCLSYLRGPLTRNQIRDLMDPQREKFEQAAAAVAPLQSQPAAQSKPAPTPRPDTPAIEQVAPISTEPADAETTPSGVDGGTPILAPSINQAYIPLKGRPAQGEAIIYRPMVLGSAQVAFINDRINLRKSRELLLTTPVTDDIFPVDWSAAESLELALTDLETGPVAGATFEELPTSATDSKNYTKWAREFTDWIYRNEMVELLQSKRFKHVSEPGESERDFRVRLQQSAREERDKELEKLRNKYSKKIDALEEKIRRSELTLRSKEEQAKQHKMQTVVSVGATLLGSFLGKSPISTSTLGRATTAARGAGRVLKGQEDVKRAAENVEVYRQQLEELEEEFKRETDLLNQEMDPLTEELDQFTVKPLKKNILLKTFALAWLPYRRTAAGLSEPAW
jgi:hypothetical protein